MSNKASMDDVSEQGAKQHAPATLRNRDAILGVLRQELPEWGVVLEIASGSGEHAIYFAENMSALTWQPSDPDPGALASIKAYGAEYPGVNLREPVRLDACAATWPIKRADAMVCINMAHISPWASTEGLFDGAARTMDAPDAPLILYGPYFENNVQAAPSNLQFDVSLKSRNPDWGIRRIEDMDKVAEQNGFIRTARFEMPANNLSLVYRRQ
ncbi:DUF938 domain-containing protein [Erythrobacter sp. YT30]|uniref:DUF938 domain-containing protein n=1 Tax=Erythrobacter sp. YT30 TaxID=1735012 RepID=UPI00076CFBA4|nr:DUF938 domain-containing protein [Erythrobacter sp. YT30]KWV90507.1 SAM-dependent methyltransferase [Erythrobacter sp. YT30]